MLSHFLCRFLLSAEKYPSMIPKKLKVCDILPAELAHQKNYTNRIRGEKMFIQKAARVFSAATTAATFLVILAVSVFCVPKLAGIQPYIVLSGFMEPKIPTGSVAFINTRDTDVSVGDIITYRIPSAGKGETLVTHRIVREEDGAWIMKGDANDVEDLTPVQKQQVVGRYSFSIPKAGYLAAKMDKKTAVITVIWIVLLNGMSIVLRYADVHVEGHAHGHPAG